MRVRFMGVHFMGVQFTGVHFFGVQRHGRAISMGLQSHRTGGRRNLSTPPARQALEDDSTNPFAAALRSSRATPAPRPASSEGGSRQSSLPSRERSKASTNLSNIAWQASNEAATRT